jgi:tetratricopeptide (TPR) repeat protein
MNIKLFYIIITLLLIVTSAFADKIQKKITDSALGKIYFPTSTNHAAETYFVTGVLYLHNFEYERARVAFQQAEKADPGFALAYWGEAMTYNHPLWNEQDLIAGRQALEKLAPTDELRVKKTKSEKEKGYIDAVNLLFGKGTKLERDAAYSKSMLATYRKFPNDDEIAMFYTLSLLGLTEGARDVQVYMQAAAIAEEVYQHNQEHPGALHYAIHAYDDPIHAPLGLRAARIYAQIAPDASHALHMTSHIFLALGLWDDVITSNKSAWEAGLKNNRKGNPKNYTIHDFHALQWLVYGYLQKQQYQEAYQLVKTMMQIAEASNTPTAKFHYALMRSAYVIESRDWKTDLKSIDMNEMEPASRATDIYTNAVIALNKNHDVDLSAYMNEIEEIGKAVNGKIGKSVNKLDQFTLATSNGKLIEKIIMLEMRAQIHLQQGELKEAIRIMHEAIQLEDQLPIGYGPPVPIKPSHELLADLLFLNHQYLDAYDEYINELKRAPNRSIANQGLKLTTEKIKEQGIPIPEGIKTYFNKLMMERNADD